MIKRIVNGIGFTLGLIGLAGIGGNIELDKSVALPLVVLTAGALMLGSTTIYEVIKDDKINRNSSSNYVRNDARPYYLR